MATAIVRVAIDFEVEVGDTRNDETRLHWVLDQAKKKVAHEVNSWIKADGGAVTHCHKPWVVRLELDEDDNIPTTTVKADP